MFSSITRDTLQTHLVDDDSSRKGRMRDGDVISFVSAQLAEQTLSLALLMPLCVTLSLPHKIQDTQENLNFKECIIFWLSMFHAIFGAYLCEKNESLFF